MVTSEILINKTDFICLTQIRQSKLKHVYTLEYYISESLALMMCNYADCAVETGNPHFFSIKKNMF